MAKIKDDIANYEEATSKYTEKGKDAKGHLERITGELADVDTRLKKLQPRLKLDRLEDRCKLT